MYIRTEKSYKKGYIELSFLEGDSYAGLKITVEEAKKLIDQLTPLVASSEEDLKMEVDPMGGDTIEDYQDDLPI